MNPRNTAADLATIDYPNGTPDVGYTFDRRGRRVGISDGVGNHTLTYNDAGQLLTDITIGGPMLNRVLVSNTYDALLRRTGLQASNSDIYTTQTFSYDAASRLASVGLQPTALSPQPLSVDYSYLPNSSLPATLTFKTGATTRMTTTKSWDNLNRLVSVNSVNPVNSVSSSA